jgi:hypothetical protein
MKTKLIKTPYGQAQQWIENDIENTFFCNDLAHKIYNLRNGKQYRFNPDENGKIINHPLEGKELINFNDKHCFVESVHKHWLMGFYLMILYYTITDNGSKSHGTIFYENINSHDPFIIETTSKYKNIKFK